MRGAAVLLAVGLALGTNPGIAAATVYHNPPWADAFGNKWPGTNGLNTKGSRDKIVKLGPVGYSTFTNTGTAAMAMSTSAAQADAVWATFGHGGNGFITYYDGTTLSELNASSAVPGSQCGSPKACISSYTTAQLHAIKVMVFGGCDTGLNGSTGAAYNANLVDYAYSGRGVDSAVGWTALIYWPMMDSWSDAFFISLAGGNSVVQSWAAGRDRVQYDYGGFYGIDHVRLLGGGVKVVPAGYGS